MRTHGLDACRNAVRGFAVACVGDGFAAAAVNSIVEFGHHHDSFGLAAAADCECAGNRPALDLYGESSMRVEQYDRAFRLAQGLPAQGLRDAARAFAGRDAMSAASLAAAARGRSRRAAGFRRLDGGARRRARTPDRGREPPACRRALDRHRPRRARAARHLRRVADRTADARLHRGAARPTADRRPARKPIAR